MCHHFLWWVRKFFLVPFFQILLVWILFFLLTPTFHRHTLLLVALMFGTSVAGVFWSVIYFWIVLDLHKMLYNYHYLLRKSPEERSSHLLRGGSLKSRIVSVWNIGENGWSPCCEYLWYGTCYCAPLFDTWMYVLSTCDSKTVKCFFLNKPLIKRVTVHVPTDLASLVRG
jgi:hypothetical protein